jgi:cephalosporin hydroxylase
MNHLAKQIGDMDKAEHYLDIYEKLFSPLKDKELRILEIGVQKGGSIELWKRYFINAEIIGLDIHISECKHRGERITLISGNQSDKELLESLGSFDIVIDDGGHTMEQQQTSFEILYPKLNAGGIYIIEDLHTSYWKEFQDKKPTTIDFLKSLIETVNEFGIKHDRSNCKELKFPKYEVNSISFFKSLCVIQK